MNWTELEFWTPEYSYHINCSCELEFANSTVNSPTGMCAFRTMWPSSVCLQPISTKKVNMTSHWTVHVNYLMLSVIGLTSSVHFTWSYWYNCQLICIENSPKIYAEKMYRSLLVDRLDDEFLVAERYVANFTPRESNLWCQPEQTFSRNNKPYRHTSFTDHFSKDEAGPKTFFSEKPLGIAAVGFFSGKISLTDTQWTADTCPHYSLCFMNCTICYQKQYLVSSTLSHKTNI